MRLPEIDFSSLEIREIGSWPLILRVPVAIAVLIVAIGISFYFVLSHKVEELNAAETKLDAKRKDFKDKYIMSENLDAYKAQNVQMQSDYQEFIKELPSASNIPELIDSISKIGERSRLSFNSIKIGSPQLVSGFYMSLPLTLNITGTYHGFGLFVSDVARLPRIVTFGDFDIKPIAEAGSGGTKGAGPQGLLTMNIEAKTYWLASQMELQQQPKAAPTTKGATPAGKGVPGKPRTPGPAGAPGPAGGPNPAAGPGSPTMPTQPGANTTPNQRRMQGKPMPNPATVPEGQ